MAQASKTFRIFVSSTFSDLKAERNALQQEVFPKLRELCQQHGCRFQAIDLRWGVSEEAALDQQTMKICLTEIERCRKTTPRPNFIVLLGERYGWRPLPAEIPAEEFAQIEPCVTYADDKTLLALWYKRDDNAVPAVYCLQPRAIGLGNNPAEREAARQAEAEAWSKTEQKLRRILLAAIAELSFTAAQRLKYEASATEQEILAGALNEQITDARDHVFGFFHSFKTLPQEASAKDFVDLDENGKPDSEAHTRLGELKERLRQQLPGNIVSYETEWTDKDITTAHLGQLCADVYQALSRVILAEIAQLEAANLIEEEAGAHERFGAERTRFFTGRTNYLQAISDYMKSADPHPLATYGASGSGKSALLAQAIAECGSRNAECVIVSRFIGATPNSSDGRALLESLCREISRRYGADEASVPAEYQKLVEEFPKRLALATPSKPLIVFLDALDQLSDFEHARNLIWLPASLPAHVRLIVSTLDPGECLTQLKRKLPAANLVQLEPMPQEEGGKLLDLWLVEAGRTLQDEQRAEVLGKFAANGLPLYLKLAFEEARLWKSYDDSVRDLTADIPGIVRGMFDRFEEESNHGRVLVSRSMAYLSAARHGLTEDELLDVLSADEEVVSDFHHRSPKSPEADRLPVVVWSRLYFDLEPYLTERRADHTLLLSFYHRQLGEIVSQWYLTGDDKLRAHRRLAAHFSGGAEDPRQPYQLKDADGSKIPNYRKLSELPHQQAQGELWDDLAKLMRDQVFIGAIEAAGMGPSLQEDFRFGIECSVDCGHPFVACSLAEIRSRLVLDSAVVRNPALLGLITYASVRELDRSLLERILSTIFQVEDTVKLTAGCIEVLLAGSKLLSLAQQDQLTAIIYQGLLQTEYAERSSSKLENVPDINILHGRAYAVMSQLAYIHDHRSLVQALSIYANFPNAWSVTNYALRSQVETATVRRNHIEQLIIAADEDPEVCRLIKGFLRDSEVLQLIDVERFTTLGDLFIKVRPQISDDRIARVLYKVGREDVLSDWLASLEQDRNGDPVYRRMRIELARGNRAGALKVLKELEPPVNPAGRDYQYYANRIGRDLRLWSFYGHDDVILDELRIVHNQLERFRTIERFLLRVDWLYLAARHGWPEIEVQNIWRQIIRDDWPVCRDSAELSKHPVGLVWKLLKGTLPAHITTTEELYAIDGWIKECWEHTRSALDLEAWAYYAEYAASPPLTADLLSDILKRFSQYLNSLLGSSADDESLEKAIYFGERISVIPSNLGLSSFDPVLSQLTMALQRIRSEERIAIRATSLLANLLSANRTEAVKLAQQLLQPNHRQEPLVMMAISSGLKAIALKTCSLPGTDGIESLKTALSIAKTLSTADFKHFGSVLLSARTQYYDADFVNRESAYEMNNAGFGAHTDAFDYAPVQEVELILELILAEAFIQYDQLDEARSRLQTLVDKSKSILQIKKPSNKSRHAMFMAENILELARPLSERLGLTLNLPVVPTTPQKDFGDLGTFEQFYHYLLNIDDWAGDLKSGLLSKIILRASTEPFLRCHFLLLLLLRGLSKQERVTEYLNTNDRQEAMLKFLAIVGADELSLQAKAKDRVTQHFLHLGTELWDSQLELLGLKLWVNACAFSLDETRIAELATLIRHNKGIRACAFSPDGTRIVSGSIDGALRLWNAENGVELATLDKGPSAITACAFSPDGTRVVSAYSYAYLKLWDVETESHLATLVGHQFDVTACAFSPDGGRIVSASYDGTLKLWDGMSGEEVATLAGYGDFVLIKACAFSPDGSLIVSASDDETLKLWDVTTGAELTFFTGHTSGVLACTFSPDSTRIVSTSMDKTLMVWSAILTYV